ncbi:hypothetical protein [Kaarinaea lacus]
MKKQQQNKTTPNRRSGNERRTYETDLGFPFIDTHGHLVTEDRRSLTDRRTVYDDLQADSLDQLEFGEQTA